MHGNKESQKCSKGVVSNLTPMSLYEPEKIKKIQTSDGAKINP